MCISCVLYKYIVFVSCVYYEYIICSVYCVYIICMLCMYHMLIMCISSVYYEYTVCIFCVCHVCVMCISCVYHVYIISISCLNYVHTSWQPLPFMHKIKRKIVTGRFLVTFGHMNTLQKELNCFVVGKSRTLPPLILTAPFITQKKIHSVYKVYGTQNDRLKLTVSTQKSVLKNMQRVLRYWQSLAWRHEAISPYS